MSTPNIGGPRTPALPLRLRLTAAVAVVAACLPALPAAADPLAAPASDEVVRLLVGLDPDVVVPASARPAPVTDRIDPLGIEVLDVPAAEVEATLQRLRADRRFRFAEPDVEVVADRRTPNDPLWAQQWGLPRIGAPAAWSLTTGDAAVTIAVLDSGVDATHPDLRGAVLPGRSFVGGGPATRDVNGHGTSAAGVAAARGDNRAGIAGVCWQCRILPVTVLGEDGRGSMSAVAQGLVWAADQGAQVASLSLGSTGTSQAIADAVAYATDKGTLVVASAGNAGTTARRYPAALDDVLSVAGSTNRDGRYDWSSHGSWVDLAAPGCNVATRTGGGYRTFCGTSSATPLVAGAAALAFANTPAATPRQVRDALTTSAVPASFVRHGRLAADATLHRLQRTLAPPPSPAPAAQEDDGPTSAGARPIARACPTATTVDTAGDVHRPAAVCLDAWRVGIFPLDDFRPGEAMTRGQFAAQLDRLLDATGRVEQPARPGTFTDTAGHAHASAIGRLAGLGVLQGYPDGSFRPDASIRRDQMASLMSRLATDTYGLALPAPTASDFRDVGRSSPHHAAVHRLAAAGIITGVDRVHYVPGRAVTRGQTATLTARLLDLLVVEGATTAAAPPGS